MGHKLADPPFSRGKTLFGAAVATTTTVAATDGAHIVGREFEFEDLDYSVTTGVKPVRSNRLVRVRAVRNYCVLASGGQVTTAALLPSRLVSMKAAYYNTAVDGYARLTAGSSGAAGTPQPPCYPVDEFLPSAGAALYDVFYVVVKGPAMVLTDIAQVVDIVFGDNLVALTAASSGATTAGRAACAVYTGSTQVLADAVRNSIGRALSAATSGNTNTGILCDVGYACW